MANTPRRSRQFLVATASARCYPASSFAPQAGICVCGSLRDAGPLALRFLHCLAKRSWAAYPCRTFDRRSGRTFYGTDALLRRWIGTRHL